MKWNIIADSSYDLCEFETGNKAISFSTIPFTISVGNRDFVDNPTLNVGEMMSAMEQCKEASHTSCPSLFVW